MTIMDKEEHNSTKDKNTKRKNVTTKKVPAKKDKVKKKVPVWRYKIISFLMIILTVIMVGVVIYNGLFSIVSTILFIVVVGIILFGMTFLLVKTKLRTWIKNILSFFGVLIIIVDILMIFFGTATLKFLSNITDTGYRVETYGVYVLDSSTYDGYEDLNNKDIRYLSTLDNDNVLKAIKKMEKEISLEYDSIEALPSLLNVLINEEVAAIVFEVGYEELLSEEYADDYKLLKKIHEIDIIDNVNTIKSDVNLTEEAFIVYISGIDTVGNVSSKARSDVNILVAVNPKTKNIMMINTPRDYYVTLHSTGEGDKLTHAGLYGIEESIYTLEDLYGVTIDYYVRANFTSVLKMIDALEGVVVDVPIEFCEQDSNRSFAKDDLICLKKGKQSLNGEEALALARHRKTLATGDRARGNNQMLVLEAMIKKALSPKIITNYSSLINALQGRIVTNVTTDEMYLGAKMLAKNTSGWKFSSVSAKGSDGSKPCYAIGNGYSSVLIKDEEYIKSIKEAINSLLDGDADIKVQERKSEATSY